MYRIALCDDEQAEAEFFSLLDKQVEFLSEECQKYVALQVDNRTLRVMVHDIVYCESQGKRQYLHLSMVGLEEKNSSFQKALKRTESMI